MSDRASILLLGAVLVTGVVEVVELHRQLRLLERATAPSTQSARHLRLVTTT